jgi:hypothetical protein
MFLITDSLGEIPVSVLLIEEECDGDVEKVVVLFIGNS